MSKLPQAERIKRLRLTSYNRIGGLAYVSPFYVAMRTILSRQTGGTEIVMDLLEVGKIVNTHGLRGDVKVATWTDYPEDFEDIEYVYIKKKSDYERLDISNIKYQKGNLIVKFAQIKDINEAERYKNSVLYAERDMLGELPEGVHYIADLIGLDVVTEDGEKIGVIADVFNTGSSDIYDVKREGKKNMLLPVIDDVVLNIDIEAKKVTVHILDGLEDL